MPLRSLLLLAAVLGNDVPINEGNYHEPEWFTPVMQFSDRFGFILWPALAVGVLAVVVVAVLKASTHKSIPGPERMRIKKEIVQELRRQIHGMSLEQIAKLVAQPREPLHEFLGEMAKDGLIRSSVNSKGATIYKLPGM